MATITLASIREAADKKFGSTDIELEDGSKVVLRNALKLSKEERAVLSGVSEAMKAEGADEAAALENALLTAAASKADGQKLINACGHDVTVLLGVFEQYGKGTELGEASDSES